uniref:MULE domain-containing protein n=1 Tax=Strongyloides papillosus TaxID=174720 RepID=A0A0N5CHH7_STREA
MQVQPVEYRPVINSNIITQKSSPWILDLHTIYRKNSICFFTFSGDNLLTWKGYRYIYNVVQEERICCGCKKIRQVSKKSSDKKFGQIHNDGCESIEFLSVYLRNVFIEICNEISDGSIPPVDAYRLFLSKIALDCSTKYNVSYEQVVQSKHMENKCVYVDAFKKQKHRNMKKLVDKVGKCLYDENSQYIHYSEDESFIMIVSDKMLDIFCSSDTLIMDGTFKSCPKEFNQLFGIHSVDKFSRNGICLIYMLTLSRTVDVYSKAFTYLRNLCESRKQITNIPFNHNKCVISDKEMNVVKAFSNIFPQTNHKLCLFHYRRTISRKLRQYDLLYTKKRNNFILSQDNVHYRNQLKKCLKEAKVILFNLPFLDTRHLTYCFYAFVVTRINKFPNHNKFVWYFRKNWLKPYQDYHPEMICHRYTHICTSNDAEVYHSSLNRSHLMGEKSSLDNFLNSIKIFDNEEFTKYHLYKRYETTRADLRTHLELDYDDKESYLLSIL